MQVSPHTRPKIALKQSLQTVFTTALKAVKTATLKAERLDLATGSWEPLPEMRERRAYAAAGALEGKVFVCGGSTVGDVRLRSAEFYDPASNSWEAGS